mgnify:CR=1 FL=1
MQPGLTSEDLAALPAPNRRERVGPDQRPRAIHVVIAIVWIGVAARLTLFLTEAAVPAIIISAAGPVIRVPCEDCAPMPDAWTWLLEPTWFVLWAFGVGCFAIGARRARNRSTLPTTHHGRRASSS